jgi:hypothetical protein
MTINAGDVNVCGAVPQASHPYRLGFRPPKDRAQFLDIAVIVMISDGRHDTVDGFDISPGLRGESKPKTANNRDNR